MTQEICGLRGGSSIKVERRLNFSQTWQAQNENEIKNGIFGVPREDGLRTKNIP